MKPLIVLIATFIITFLLFKIFRGDWNFVFAGNLAMSVMLLFTASGHFAFPKGMAKMIPGFIPLKRSIVFVTGIIEITAAIGLMISSWRHATSIALVIFFLVILPANISAAIRKVNYQKGTNDGNGPSYLWFRVPMQLFLVCWVWYFGIYN